MANDVDPLFRITDTQAFTLQVEPDDKAGNATNLPPDAVLSWATSDPTVLMATPSSDNLTCDFETTGKLGSAQISVTSGELSGMLTIEVVPGAPTQFKLTPTDLRERDIP